MLISDTPTRDIVLFRQMSDLLKDDVPGRCTMSVILPLRFKHSWCQWLSQWYSHATINSHKNSKSQSLHRTVHTCSSLLKRHRWDKFTIRPDQINYLFHGSGGSVFIVFGKTKLIDGCGLACMATETKTHETSKHSHNCTL